MTEQDGCCGQALERKNDSAGLLEQVVAGERELKSKQKEVARQWEVKEQKPVEVGKMWIPWRGQEQWVKEPV